MANKKQSGLGKGLDSLIPDFYNEDFDSNNSMSLEDMLKEDEDIGIVIEEVSPEEKEEEEEIVPEEEEADEEPEEVEEIPSAEDEEDEEAEEVEEIDEEESEDSEDEEDSAAEASEEDVEDGAEEEEEAVDEIPEAEEDEPEEEEEEEIQLTEKELSNIAEVKGIVEKNPRITLWSVRSAAVFRYLRKTEPEFSISKEASILIEEAVREKYPEIWNLFEDL